MHGSRVGSKKLLLPCFSVHAQTHTYAHTRAHTHTCIHTVPSYESLSLPVCITFFLCVFLLHRRIAGRLSCRYNIPRKNFQFPLHKDTLGVSLSFLVSLSARMRSPPWRGGISSNLVNVGSQFVQSCLDGESC